MPTYIQAKQGDERNGRKAPHSHTEFTQFGSGFKIALRDLEIRGAGNLLGPEQHGHMEAIGYDLYCKIVDSAVREAKERSCPRT